MIKNEGKDISRIIDGHKLRAYSPGPYHTPYRVYAGKKMVFPSKEEYTPRYCLHLSKETQRYYSENEFVAETLDVIIRTSLPVYTQVLTAADASGDDWQNTSILENPRARHMGLWKRIDSVFSFALPFIERGSIEGPIKAGSYSAFGHSKTETPPAERDSTFIYVTRTRKWKTGDPETEKFATAYTPSVYHRDHFSGSVSGATHIYWVTSRQFNDSDVRFDTKNNQWVSMLHLTDSSTSTRFAYDMRPMDSFCDGVLHCPFDWHWVATREGLIIDGYEDIPFHQFYNGALSYVANYRYYADYIIGKYKVVENNNPAYESCTDWLEDICQEQFDPRPPLYPISF